MNSIGRKMASQSRGNEVRAATKIANARRGQVARRQVAQMEGWGPENVKALHNPDPFSR